MSGDDVKLWWHRYTGITAEGLELTITVGGSEKPPEAARTIKFPMAHDAWEFAFGKSGVPGPECVYVQSFDHDPSPDDDEGLDDSEFGDDDLLDDLADLTDDERAALRLDPECIYCLRPEREHTDPNVLHQFLARG